MGGAERAGQAPEAGEGQALEAPEQDGAEIYQDISDIRARLRRNSDIILADTPANRPTRIRRAPREIYPEVHNLPEPANLVRRKYLKITYLTENIDPNPRLCLIIVYTERK